MNRLTEQASDMQEIEELGFSEIASAVREALVAFLGSIVGEREAIGSAISVNGAENNHQRAGSVQPPATVRRARQKRKHYTDARPLTLKIFRAAFCGEAPPPDNLSEALERAYGNEWARKTVTTPNGASMTRRAYGDDLKNSDSIIKRGIAHTITLCLKYAEGGDAAFPANRPIGPNVKKLTHELGLSLTGRREVILGVLLEWGIPVEEPVAAG